MDFYFLEIIVDALVSVLFSELYFYVMFGLN